mmetsp:Transcript_60402/g.170192  ORF Transcript_60402/g.170192 Transcript_60402/m.170192 type:complete len:212 (+) Transcript_60402:683-1318(+)
MEVLHTPAMDVLPLARRAVPGTRSAPGSRAPPISSSCVLGAPSEGAMPSPPGGTSDDGAVPSAPGSMPSPPGSTSADGSMPACGAPGSASSGTSAGTVARKTSRWQCSSMPANGGSSWASSCLRLTHWCSNLPAFSTAAAASRSVAGKCVSGLRRRCSMRSEACWSSSGKASSSVAAPALWGPRSPPAAPPRPPWSAWPPPAAASSTSCSS